MKLVVVSYISTPSMQQIYGKIKTLKMVQEKQKSNKLGNMQI